MATHRTEPTLSQQAFGLIGSGIWLGTSLLPLPLRWAVGSTLGWLLYYTMRARRRVVIRNLELCFPQKNAAQHKQLAMQTFRNTGKGFLTWGFAFFARQRRIDQEVKWQGKDTFQTFIQLRRPVILLCPHFCTLILTLRTLGAQVPIVSMYRPPRNPIMDMGFHCALTGIESNFNWLNWIYRRRGSHHIRMIPSRGNMRPFYQALESGTPFFYLPDQNANRPAHATFVPFFGVQASTYTSLTRFAQFRNARIILCHMVMSDQNKSYELQTELLPEDFISGDLRTDAEKLNQLIESLVRQNPDQYFWAHKRFATRPEGDAPIY